MGIGWLIARLGPGLALGDQRGEARAAGALAAAALVAVVLAGCEEKASPAITRPPTPVSVAAAITHDVPVYLDEIGKCVAREVVSIQPQASGRITAIHFADGADVRAGDLLFTIDPRPSQAALQQAQATLAKDEALAVQAQATLDRDVANVEQAGANLARDLAQAKNAEVQARRYADLLKQGLVAQQDYDQFRTTAESLQATVQADQAALASAQEAVRADQAGLKSAQETARADRAAVESARLQLEYTAVRSPIDGRAGHRLVDLGNVVAANTGSLLVIARLDPIYADFTVPENDLTAVQRHMAQGTLRVEVRLPDEPDAVLDGQLTFLDNAVQESTGTVMLRATVPNRDHRLWPGRFVKVRLVLSTLQGAVLVPAVAPQVSAKGPFVYVVGADATAELRPVTLGQRQGDLVVITQGLKAGERVVVMGQLGVTPGGKVQVEKGAPTNPPAPAGKRP